MLRFDEKIETRKCSVLTRKTKTNEKPVNWQYAYCELSPKFHRNCDKNWLPVCCFEALKLTRKKLRFAKWFKISLRFPPSFLTKFLTASAYLTFFALTAFSVTWMSTKCQSRDLWLALKTKKLKNRQLLMTKVAWYLKTKLRWIIKTCKSKLENS